MLLRAVLAVRGRPAPQAARVRDEECLACIQSGSGLGLVLLRAVLAERGRPAPQAARVRDEECLACIQLGSGLG